MLLVLIAVAMATILALSFLAAQGPTAVVATNIDRKAKARAIAESALQMGMSYVDAADWRSEKSAGVWMSGVSLHGGSFDLHGTDDDGDLDNDPGDTLVLTAIGRFEGVTHRVSARVTPAVPPFAMEAGTIEVGGTPVEVTLQGSYTRPVVVCCPQVADNTKPLVVRVDTVTGGSFRVWLQRPDGGPVQADTVHYMVMEEGVYNLDGFRCEARRFESSQTDSYTSWRGVARSYGNTYSQPVVFGQVMSARDPDWSYFWSMGSNTGSAASAGALHVGKTVGEDPDTDRASETLGYIVFESGRHTINDVAIDVRLTADTVMGVTNGSGSDAAFHRPFTTTPEVVIACQSGMDGNNGSWAMLWGAASITTTRARVIVDEDELRDPERSHTTEQVGVVAFERPPDATAERVVLQYEFDQAQFTPQAVGHWRLDEPAGGGGGVAAYDRVYLNHYARIDSYDSARGAYGPDNNAESATVSTNSTGSNKVLLNSHTRVEGDAYVGPGGNPESGVNVYSFSYLTGDKREADTPAVLPDLTPPGDMPATRGNVSYSGGEVVIDTDTHFTDLTLSHNAVVRIRGSVRVLVSDDLRMQNNSAIVLDPGATLSLWLGDSAELRDDARLNADSAATDRVDVYVYGNNDRLRLRDRAVMAASAFVDGDLRLEHNAAFFGRALAGDDVELYSNATFHADIALPTLGIATTPAVDEVIANDGSYRGDAVGGWGKPTALLPAGTSARFDGTGDAITIPHSDSYLLNDGTVSFWFNADVTAGRQGLFCKDASGLGEGGHLSIALVGATLTARLDSTARSYQLSSGTLSAGRWYHVALAFGAEGLTLYLDGIQVDALPYGGGLNTTSGGLGNREPIVIGADASGASSGTTTPLTGHFAGRIDDVRLYDQWCSAAQVGEVLAGSAPSTRFSQTLIRDTGNYGDPLHLTLEDPTRVTWGPGTLTFDGPTLARSLIDAGKAHDALSESGAFSLVLRFTRADPVTTASPSVIMGISASLFESNLMIGQSDEGYDARVRTRTTGVSGRLSPPFESAAALDHDRFIHLAMTYDGAFVRTYLDGTLHLSRPLTGDLGGWSTSLPAVVGGAASGGCYWLGTIDSARLYDRALTGKQVENLAMGMPMNAAADGSGSVVWDEID